MSLTRTSAYNLVPLLSRLVLAAAFVPAGWDKIMGDEQVFEGDAAQLLERLGVGQAVEATSGLGLQTDVLASYQQDVETGSLVQKRRPRPDPPMDEQPIVIQAPPPQPVTKPVIVQPIPPEPDPEPDPEPPVVQEPVKSGPGTAIQAKRLHNVTVMLVSLGRWPENLKPDWMAWAAAGTELVGGGLILIGLFSRIWGLGLAITMGFAFYLTSLTGVTEYGLFALPIADFNQVFTQITLGVMALGVFLTGAGAFSLDRMLFRSGADEEEEHLLHLG